jgi:hypothetical protein
MSAPSFFVYIDAPSGRGLEHPRHNPHYKQSTKVSLSEQTGGLAASTMLAIPCSLAHKTQEAGTTLWRLCRVVESP